MVGRRMTERAPNLRGRGGVNGTATDRERKSEKNNDSRVNDVLLKRMGYAYGNRTELI